MKIVGIAGTNGSGKDTLAQILADDYGWLFISVTDILRDELKRQGLPTERKYTRDLSTKWREQFGVGVLIDKAYEIYKPKEAKYNGLVISSLRNSGEVEEVHQLGGKVVWVDAEPRVRYGRINARARGVEDQKSFEEFIHEEAQEMHSTNKNSLNASTVKQRADIFIQNDGGLADFKAEIIKKLALT